MGPPKPTIFVDLSLVIPMKATMVFHRVCWGYNYLITRDAPFLYISGVISPYLFTSDGARPLSAYVFGINVLISLLQNVVGIVIAPCYGVPARDFAAIQVGGGGAESSPEVDHIEVCL